MKEADKKVTQAFKDSKAWIDEKSDELASKIAGPSDKIRETDSAKEIADKVVYKGQKLAGDVMESAKDAGNKVVDTAKEIVEHPILSVEHGYEAVKEKVIDASEGIKAAVKKSSEK